MTAVRQKTILTVIAVACLLWVAGITQIDLATQTKNILPAGSLPTASVCMPGAFTAQADGSTVTWAIGSQLCANASLLFTAHGGNRTLNLSGLVNGGSYILKVQQDATGGEGLILASGCAWQVSGGGGHAVALSTGALAIDTLVWTYDGTNCLLNFAPNFN